MSSDLVRGLILASAFNGNYDLDPVVVSELSTFDQFEKVTSFWCHSLELNYQGRDELEQCNKLQTNFLFADGPRRHGYCEKWIQGNSLQQGLKYSSLFLNFPPYARVDR